MLALARRVEWRATGSDLEARLEEARRIVAGRPCYNRALGTERAAGTWRSIGAIHSHDRGSYGFHVARALDFGPYRGRATPERVARLIERAFGLRSCCGRVLPDPAGSPCLAHEIALLGAMHRRGEFVGLQATGGGRYPRWQTPASRSRWSAWRPSGTRPAERWTTSARPCSSEGSAGWTGWRTNGGRSSGPGWSARG